MLLELFRWLEQLQSLFGLFGYLTFRGILSALTALALSLWWGPAIIRRLEKAALVGEHHRLDAVAQAELLEDVRDVGLDGRLADVELLPDLGVREAVGHQAKDV